MQHGGQTESVCGKRWGTVLSAEPSVKVPSAEGQMCFSTDNDATDTRFVIPMLCVV